MDEYIGFIDEIGRTTDGRYLYRFDFTIDTETIWGDFFNIAPSAIVPDLQPDRNALSHTGRVVFPRELVIAKRNYCFSMQDCIDGIIPLCFCEIDENTILYDDKPFFIRFGETMDEVVKKLSSIGLELYGLEEVEKGDDTAITDLINSIDNGEGNLDIKDDF